MEITRKINFFYGGETWWAYVNARFQDSEYGDTGNVLERST